MSSNKYLEEYVNLIPDYVFGDTLLDVGAGIGFSQLNSRHKEKFRELNDNGSYLGIEIEIIGDPLLNMKEIDILQFETNKKFDTVLAISVLEHISYRKWPVLAKKLKSWINKGGYLVIIVPAKEKIDGRLDQSNIDYYNQHVVFGVTKKVLKHFYPNSMILTRKISVFRREGESFVHAVGRLIKRCVLSRPYYLSKEDAYIVIWKRE